ncbi:hypothetical protein [Zwartia sp.]|uniref:hypothetical protein n=1 Tax=Zwartia sp. TaxID=2978004 RepID=UPI003BAF43FF
MRVLLGQLSEQRWDDHRLYHHSRINQSLHLISALSFIFSYVMLFINPVVASLVAWMVSMTTRQAGHFFFEPRGYDHVNKMTDAHKEDIKVGYNIQRKIVLMSVWASVPFIAHFYPQALIWAVPTEKYQDFVGLTAIWWLYLGVGGLLFRMLQLWIQDNYVSALAWGLKIITDPFHDVKLYYKAPLRLMQGELIDPMQHVHSK